jgi:hypothetical protein
MPRNEKKILYRGVCKPNFGPDFREISEFFKNEPPRWRGHPGGCHW